MKVISTKNSLCIYQKDRQIFVQFDSGDLYGRTMEVEINEAQAKEMMGSLQQSIDAFSNIDPLSFSYVSPEEVI